MLMCGINAKRQVFGSGMTNNLKIAFMPLKDQETLVVSAHDTEERQGKKNNMATYH